MIRTDYPLEALDILLDVAVLSERYHPLVGYKAALRDGLRSLGCHTKSDAEQLPDAAFAPMGVSAPEAVRLLRRFFALYDPDPKKFREIARIPDAGEREAFRELYHLPGVRQTRAALYCRAGYRSLPDFAAASVDEVIARTARVITEENLSCAVPLPKEVRTQIAVARAFTGAF